MRSLGARLEDVISSVAGPSAGRTDLGALIEDNGGCLAVVDIARATAPHGLEGLLGLDEGQEGEEKGEEEGEGGVPELTWRVTSGLDTGWLREVPLAPGVLLISAQVLPSDVSVIGWLAGRAGIILSLSDYCSSVLGISH